MVVNVTRRVVARLEPGICIAVGFVEIFIRGSGGGKLLVLAGNAG
jgi:hypothetical protein